jgi:hypothetical protein
VPRQIDFTLKRALAAPDNIPGSFHDDPDVSRDLHDPLPEPGSNTFADEEHLALITALVKIFSGFDDIEGQDEGRAGS